MIDVLLQSVIIQTAPESRDGLVRVVRADKESDHALAAIELLADFGTDANEIVPLLEAMVENQKTVRSNLIQSALKRTRTLPASSPAVFHLFCPYKARADKHDCVEVVAP